MEKLLHIEREDYKEIYDINLDLLRKMDFNDICKMNEENLEWLLYLFVCEDKEK